MESVPPSVGSWRSPIDLLSGAHIPKYHRTIDSAQLCPCTSSFVFRPHHLEQCETVSHCRVRCRVALPVAQSWNSKAVQVEACFCPNFWMIRQRLGLTFKKKGREPSVKSKCNWRSWVIWAHWKIDSAGPSVQPRTAIPLGNANKYQP